MCSVGNNNNGCHHYRAVIKHKYISCVTRVFAYPTFNLFRIVQSIKKSIFFVFQPKFPLKALDIPLKPDGTKDSIHITKCSKAIPPGKAIYD